MVERSWVMGAEPLLVGGKCSGVPLQGRVSMCDSIASQNSAELEERLLNAVITKKW